MSETPPISSPGEAQEQPRQRWTWIVLWIVFGLLLVRAVAGSYERPKGADDYRQEAMVLKQTVLIDRLMDGLRSLMPDEASRRSLESASRQNAQDSTTSKLVGKLKTDPMAAKLYAALQTERKKPIGKDDLAILRNGASPADRAFARIYEAQTLTLPQARSLASKIPKEPFVNAVARAHALAKAGDRTELARLAPQGQVLILVLAVPLILVAVLCGLVLAVSYLAMRRSGQLPAKGHPFEPLSGLGADALALRATQLIAGFLVLGLLYGFLAPLPPGLPSVAMVVAMGAFTVWLFSIPVFGKRFPLSRLGLVRRGQGKNVLWGLAGYFGNLPFLLAAALIVSAFTKFFPEARHPAIDVLTNHPTPAILFGLWLQAAVLAPFWEEIMFRGCLFPALTKVTGSPLAGAAISSLMFASIHPQGILGWLPIATIAMVNCLLAYQTRSLIPCMILHAVNNTVALALSLVLLAK